MKKKEKEIKRIWKEIRTTHFDEETGITYVDGYKTNDENEEGMVIAKIDDKGVVTYIDDNAKSDKYAQEEIQAAIQRIDDERHEIVDKLIEELKKDFLVGDYTVIDEILVHNVPLRILKASLPEEL